MMESNHLDERILILAPVGRDGPAMATLLTDHGLKTTICQSATELHLQMRRGSGAVVLTDEALERAQFSEFLDQLQSQPSWSELPLIILTHGGESRVARLLDTVAAAANGITVLERPIGSSTLLRAVKVAIRSRRRQYQVRDLLLESKQAEAALRKSDERYRFIAETAEVGYWDWDIIHDVLEWGAVCKRLFGLSEDEEISYSRFLEVVHADDREKTDQAVRVCLSGAGAYDVDYRAVWPDLTLHWIRAKGNAQFENGKAVRMAGVAFDISSSKRNLEALAATQERLQLAQNAGRLAIWDWDLASDRYRWTGDVGSLYGSQPNNSLQQTRLWMPSNRAIATLCSRLPRFQ